MVIKYIEDSCCFNITEIHPNDFRLIKDVIDFVYCHLNDSTMTSIADEQDKERLAKHMEKILLAFNEQNDSSTAESYEMTLIRKSFE